MLWGNGRSPKGAADAMHLTVLDETPADPGTQVGLRVINATSAAIDARAYAAAPRCRRPPPGPTSRHTVRPTWVNQAPGMIDYNIRAAGGTTAMFADRWRCPAPRRSRAPARRQARHRGVTRHARRRIRRHGDRVPAVGRWRQNTADGGVQDSQRRDDVGSPAANSAGRLTTRGN